MRRSFTRHYPSVAATLALVVALGGTAWALQRNSVKSPHIVNGSVKSVDLKDGQVRSKDIKDRGIREEDLGNGVVSADELAPFVVREDDHQIPHGQDLEVSSECGASERLISGGVRYLHGSTDVVLRDSYAAMEDPNSWMAFVYNDPGIPGPSTVRTYAVCAGEAVG